MPVTKEEVEKARADYDDKAEAAYAIENTAEAAAMAALAKYIKLKGAYENERN